MTEPLLLRQLRQAWAAEDHPHAKPATAEEIAAFEARYNIRLPDDFRDYFATLNGGEQGHDGSLDHDLISFWTLDQVRTQAELNEGKGGRDDLFGFADWCIDCHTYAIEFHSDPDAPTPVFIDYGRELQKVADSFSEFIPGYLKCDERILYGIDRPKPNNARGPSA